MVLLAQVSDLGKPGVLHAMVKDVQPMLVEDVRGAEECNHVEEGELVFVDQCWGREGAGKEVQSWGRSGGVEALEPLKCQPSMDRQHFHL